MKEKYIFVIINLIFFLQITSLYSQQASTNLKTLTKNSEVILIGKVSMKESKWNGNKSRIYTDVTIEVDEYLKGQKSEISIIVRHPGGEVGEVGELYTHMPTFKEDETMVLFVNKNKIDGKYRVNNGENGKIQLVMDKSSGEHTTVSSKKLMNLRKQIKSYQDK